MGVVVIDASAGVVIEPYQYRNECRREEKKQQNR